MTIPYGKIPWLMATLLGGAVGIGLPVAVAATPGPGVPWTIPEWSASASVESSYGFRDNLLLSSSGEERSAFFRGSADVLMMRIPSGPWDYSLLAQAAQTHYFSGRTVTDVAQAWLQSDLGYRWGDSWKVSLPVTGYYFDQVYDVSDTEVERLVAELRGGGGMVGPLMRWSFHPRAWVEFQGTGDRKKYRDGIYDSRVHETVLRFGWVPTSRVETRWSVWRRWRDFDARSQYSAAGRELPGTHLKVRETEGEARADITWDEAGAWKTVTRVGVLQYQDNGSGYFNRREGRADLEVEWKGVRWFVRVRGEARRIEFDVQTVGIGIAPPPRLKEEYEAELRIERKLGERWTLCAGYTWERSRSNDQVVSYTVNEGLLGLRWSWEK